MIRTETNDGVAVVAFARPEKKNALTPEMLRRFVEAVGELSSETRVLVVTGEGDTFCSGFDLALCRDNSDALRELLSGLSGAVATLRGLDVPVIAAVRGAAIAGGCALLGGADVVVTHDDAKLGYPVVRLGISPAVSLPFLLPTVGPSAARARTLDPSLVSGREALRLGLAHECVATGEEVASRAMAIAAELAAKPRVGLRATKQWMNELDGTGSAEAARRGLEVSLSLAGSEEERTRLAELWKRTP